MNNLLGWILFILIAHSILYYTFGTPNWFGTALLATVVWAVVLYGIRYFVRDRNKERV
ncbi:hypothetical protein [Ammoniphilus resinae]|uniref:Membrane protein YdbS with pleckstrin-like domain n=1 Tax=Ammoniphilus resinae TaxID=861532 RepID=A0ABS4GTM7_9BACL|nr:hypothetical protein [Ammoniphilus resinae]MBP1933606.1 membrane protein YdbS with pleckstrin-like domain [Ammoniphilus resinae]